MHSLNEGSEHLIPISWSMEAGYESSGSVDRFENIYSGSITPLAVFNGIEELESWDCSLTNYQEIYDVLETLPSPLEIALQFDQQTDAEFNLSAEVEVTDNINYSENKIFFIITNWTEYIIDEEPWYYETVAISELQDFTLSNIGDTETFSANLEVDMQENWNLNDLRAVAIVQDWDSHEILQAAQVNLIPTGINDPIVPTEISLYQNYPNPFNPVTNIAYSIKDAGNVTIEVYNLRGQLVKTLVNEIKEIGDYTETWNGTDESNKLVSSGIYFYRMTSKDYSTTKKMVMMK